MKENSSVSSPRVGFCLVAVVFLLTFGSNAWANDDITEFNPDARVARGSKTTYFDLMRDVFVNAKSDGYSEITADGTVPLKQLNTGEKREGYSGRISLTFGEGFRNRAAGTAVMYFWLRPEITDSSTPKPIQTSGGRDVKEAAFLLMYFRTVGKPALLDVAEFKQGDVVTMLKKSNLPGFFWIIDAHYNCTRGMKHYDLISTTNGKLSTVYTDLPEIFDDRDCSGKLTQEPYLARGGGSILYVNIVSERQEYNAACTGRVVNRYTKYFQFKLNVPEAGPTKTLKSSAKELRKELIKLELVFPE